MKLHFYPRRHRVFAIHVDMPCSFPELLAELESIKWVSPGSLNPLGMDLWNAERGKCMTVTSSTPNLLTIQRFLSSDETKSQIIDVMHEHIPDLAWEYNFDRQRMFDHTNLHAELTRDSAGFVNVLHTDFRLLTATGMVYLMPEDSEDLSTMFYDDANRSNPLRMTTNFGDGWWHANGNNTYHEGWNRSSQYRYSFLLGLTLNVVPITTKA